MSRYEKPFPASRIVPDNGLESPEIRLKIVEEFMALQQEGVLQERLTWFMHHHGLTNRAAAELLRIGEGHVSKLKSVVDGSSVGARTLMTIASFTADYPRVLGGRSVVEIWQSFPSHKHRRSEQQSTRRSGRA